MNKLLAALGDNVKPSGKDYIARCPVHNDKDFAMSIKQISDGSVIAYCHACQANGLDLYQSLDLDLDELFGGREKDRSFLPQELMELCREDKFVIALFEADTKAGKRISLQDKRRHRLAVSRLATVKDKYSWRP